MKNPNIDRLEAKLKLWDTPGFSQFLEDLGNYTFICPVGKNAEVIKRLYRQELKELKEKQNKFKQGKLNI